MNSVIEQPTASKPPDVRRQVKHRLGLIRLAARIALRDGRHWSLLGDERLSQHYLDLAKDDLETYAEQAGDEELMVRLRDRR